MTEIEKAYCIWYNEQNPEDDPGWLMVNQNALLAFEAGWKAAQSSTAFSPDDEDKK